MSEPNDYENNIFGHGFERCSITNRPYEVGSGALSKEEQTAMFIRERDQQRQAAPEASAPPAPNAELPALSVAPLASDSKTAATLH